MASGCGRGKTTLPTTADTWVQYPAAAVHPAGPGAPTNTIGCVYGWEASVDQVIMFFLLHQGCYSYEYLISLYLDVIFSI